MIPTVGSGEEAQTCGYGWGGPSQLWRSNKSPFIRVTGVPLEPFVRASGAFPGTEVRLRLVGPRTTAGVWGSPSQRPAFPPTHFLLARHVSPKPPALAETRPIWLKDGHLYIWQRIKEPEEDSVVGTRL